MVVFVAVVVVVMAVGVAVWGIYIYIYIHREREREREQNALPLATSTLLGAVTLGTLWRLSSKLRRLQISQIWKMKAHAPCNCEVGLLKQREQVSYAGHPPTRTLRLAFFTGQ